MKYHHIIRIASFCFLCALFCCKPEQQSGSIYGTVTDVATGDCVANAGVELLPKGLKTVTGFDGTFEFSQIDPGDYNLYVTKTGYRDLKSNTITVTSGETVKGDVQIEKLPLALRVVDSDGQDISSLDFGAEPDVISRTFSIFNDSPQQLTWWVEANCNWITEVKSMLTNNQSGQLESGKQEPIKVTINRSLLGNGLKSYILNINSSNGSKELLITAGEEVGLPSLTTQPISNVTSNSVTFNGTVVNPGLPTYTERGFVYSTSEQPSIDHNLGRITAEVNNQACFSASVYNLSSNLTYYVRAYAINAIGEAYGNDMPFSTSGVPTTISTSAATNIGINSATLNGTISEEGSPCYTEKGFCYSKTGEPNISNNKVLVSGNGSGTFSANVNGLDYQTNYHVKAYAIQNGQPIYGNTVSFSTSWTSVVVNTSAVTEIGAVSAKLNGSITNAGSPEYSERGFCYCVFGEPDISSNKIQVSGNGLGEFSAIVNGLEYETTYNIKAYAIQNGQPIYGNTVSFTTVWINVRVNTSATTGIESNAATFNGSIGNAGTPAYSERGFCYKEGSGIPSLSDNKVVISGSGITGNYNKKVTGLNSGTTYSVSAYAIQNNVPVYGGVDVFSTDRFPIVTMLDYVNLVPFSSGGIILSWSVTINGFIEDAGSPAYVERGFCYDTYSNPTGNKIPVPGNGTGTFSKTINNLLNYKTYYVRAYVRLTSGKYIYSQNQVSFSTYDWEGNRKNSNNQ